LCVQFGFNAAPTHHNHSLTAGLIFWVRLTHRLSQIPLGGS